MNWNLETWGDDLTVRLRNALASNFQLLTADLDPADVVGVGAYTDADATNVVAAVHTRDHYRAALERRPQYANYFLWSIGEWDLRSFEHLDEDALQSVNSELLTRSRDASIAPARDVYRTTVWNAVVRALSEVVSNDLDASTSRARSVRSNPSTRTWPRPKSAAGLRNSMGPNSWSSTTPG